MRGRPRRNHIPEFKATVALETAQSEYTLAKRHDVHPSRMAHPAQARPTTIAERFDGRRERLVGRPSFRADRTNEGMCRHAIGRYFYGGETCPMKHLLQLFWPERLICLTVLVTDRDGKPSSRLKHAIQFS